MAELSAQLKKELLVVEEKLYSIKRGDSNFLNGQPTARDDKAKLETQQQDLIRRIMEAETAGK